VYQQFSFSSGEKDKTLLTTEAFGCTSQRDRKISQIFAVLKNNSREFDDVPNNDLSVAFVPYSYAGKVIKRLPPNSAKPSWGTNVFYRPCRRTLKGKYAEQ